MSEELRAENAVLVNHMLAAMGLKNAKEEVKEKFQSELKHMVKTQGMQFLRERRNLESRVAKLESELSGSIDFISHLQEYFKESSTPFRLAMDKKHYLREVLEGKHDKINDKNSTEAADVNRASEKGGGVLRPVDKDTRPNTTKQLPRASTGSNKQSGKSKKRN